MTGDARLSCGFPSHPKTKRLARRLGSDGPWSLVRLILWCAANKQDGDLEGMTDEDIELCVDWTGKPGALVVALLEIGFLDGDENNRQLHDWAEHNPWANGAGMRSAKARWNATKRHHGEAEANRQVPEYASVRDATSNANSMLPAMLQPDSSNAPSPSPSPSPSPRARAISAPHGAEVVVKPPTDCPASDIVATYHELLPELTPCEKITKARRGYLRQRWQEDMQTVEQWRNFFLYVRKSQFLMGKANGTKDRPPFRCTLEWLCRPTNFAKVAEGFYHRQD